MNWYPRFGPGFDESWLLRPVAERPANLQDVPSKHFRLHERVRPDGCQQLVVGDEASGVFDQIPQDRKRLGHQRHACFAPPQTLIGFVEAEWRKDSIVELVRESL